MKVYGLEYGDKEYELFTQEYGDETMTWLVGGSGNLVVADLYDAPAEVVAGDYDFYLLELKGYVSKDGGL